MTISAQKNSPATNQIFLTKMRKIGGPRHNNSTTWGRVHGKDVAPITKITEMVWSRSEAVAPSQK